MELDKFFGVGDANSYCNRVSQCACMDKLEGPVAVAGGGPKPWKLVRVMVEGVLEGVFGSDGAMMLLLRISKVDLNLVVFRSTMA